MDIESDISIPESVGDVRERIIISAKAALKEK